MSEQTPDQGSTRPNFPQIEEEMAAFWEKKRVFERSIEERPESKGYAFYDGPPFATGLPHYGHLLQSALKDAVPRYWTMQGYRVPRRWGWDCHGLPVENLIEKELKLNSKRDIESYGIEKFNDACRASVSTYEKEWDRYIKRLGRWVDFENSYKTMDDTYIESVWWVFSELDKKGFLYKDRRVSLYCPRCATPLSNFEIAMGNSYEDHEDPAVTVKFKVKGEEKTYLLAWTTTPWTLPANVAIAAHPDLMYVKVEITATGETLIFAEARMSDVLKEYYPLASDSEVPFEVLTRMKGSDLEGMRYEPLYSYLPVEGDAFRVIAMGYVSADDGTGLVHTAPAFGEDDFMASKSHNLPVLVTVDEEGRQMPEITVAAGMSVKESDAVIMEDLKTRGLLHREARITHSVPVCWRCNSLLLYKAQPAWYVNVAKLKPKLLDTAKKITWHPEHFKDGRFGKGLETAPDWCISRTRYWGAPMPVWECDSCDKRVIVSSIEELKSKAAKGSPAKFDLHRPGIDAVKLDCECGSHMSRIPEVFDCWFESGSMPYASQHYPFENKEWFDSNFPANFIAEGQDQTRGWFYSLHVLSTALFNKPAFKDVVVTGLVMAEDGKKMSKKLKNYPDPWDIMAEVGADALRFYLLSSPVVRAEQINFSRKDCEAMQRLLLGTLWNVRAFYLTYATDTKVELVKPRSAHILDRWIFARLMQVERDMTNAMDRYDLVEATRLLRPFVDDLSTWWLRRSRERMKGGNAYERLDALRTLKEVLLELSLVMAPFMPFFSEKMYQDLGGTKMSVHLDRWPKADDRLIDEQLLADMTWARDVVTRGLEARVVAKMPVRQALAKLDIVFRNAPEASRLHSRQDLLGLIRDELNVEAVGLETNASALPEIEQWDVRLDTVLTPELKKKGMLRELMRHVMNARKGAGLAPQDRIELYLAAEDTGFRDTLETMRDALAIDVKAERITVVETVPDGLAFRGDITLDGITVSLGLKKA
ncbi:MAG: isoleucine--tRNA ligase [Patescibacteria group bacterium]|jgi:isoleucyl-tRNA synthetase